MTQVTQNEERGIDYPPMTVADHESIDDKLEEELLNRTLGLDAQRVIFPILASASLNSQIAVAFINSLQKKMWSFLISDNDAEEFLIKSYKDYMTNDAESYRAFYLNPYLNTTLLIGECVNLDMSVVNGNIKLTEKEGSYKDRYTSVSYLNYIATFFDKDFLKESSNETDWESILAVSHVV